VSVQDAIVAAERLLPGNVGREGELDPRWQAIIAVGEFIESDPDAVWQFVARWGCNPDDDLRSAIATCLLEHLLEYHFDHLFPQISALARSDKFFARTVAMCWKFGDAEKPENAVRFGQLLDALKETTNESPLHVGELIEKERDRWP
jgi:hypothetical protein